MVFFVKGRTKVGVRGVKMDIKNSMRGVGAFRCNGVGDVLALLQRLDSYLQ